MQVVGLLLGTVLDGARYSVGMTHLALSPVLQMVRGSVLTYSLRESSWQQRTG